MLAWFLPLNRTPFFNSFSLYIMIPVLSLEIFWLVMSSFFCSGKIIEIHLQNLMKECYFTFVFGENIGFVGIILFSDPINYIFDGQFSELMKGSC